MARTNIRMPMSVRQRAKQFAMFDAMKGLTEAIIAKEREVLPKAELLSDRIAEINTELLQLKYGDYVCVEYYCQYISNYQTITGTIQKIDVYWKDLQIDNASIAFSEIVNILKF